MHLFQLNDDNPGELLFRYPWLPQWLVYNQEALDHVHHAALAALPPGTKTSEMTEQRWAELDKAAVDALCRFFPYVTGLDKIMEAIMAAELDPSKAPPRKRGKDKGEPQHPWADPTK